MYGMLLRRIRLASLPHLNSVIATSSNHSSNPLISIKRLPFYHSPTRLRFSSQSSSSPSALEPSAISSSSDDAMADVSTEELKKRIKRYEQGDNEAIPSIFQAILARKLSGKHEDSDAELLEDLRSKYPDDGDQQHPLDDLTDDDDSDDEDLTDDNDDLTDSDEHSD